MELTTKQPKIRHQTDVNRIREVLLGAGITCMDNEIQTIWGAYSETMAAGWLGLNVYSAEDIISIMKTYGDLHD